MIKVLKQTLVLHNSLFFVEFTISSGFKILLNHCLHVTSKPLEKAEGSVENITSMEHSEWYCINSREDIS